MTVYRSTLHDTIQWAQETLDLHPYDSNTGLCDSCRIRPCPYRDEAIRVFYRWYAALPQRRPGATHPEYIPFPAGGRTWLRRFD